MSAPVEIVCVNAGDKFPDLYVQRLYNMLGRKFARPWRLTCFTDRRRDLSAEIVQVDIVAFAAKGPFNKLLLYNPEFFPYDEALFLDITLAIKEEVGGYVDYAKSLDKDVVAIRDWRRPVMNSCVQWITKNDTLRQVWEVYESDRYPEFRTKGDQFFTFSTLQALGLEDRIGYLPDGEIQSFKILREANRESRDKFFELWAKTKIVKFHGVPRQHEVLNPWLRFWKVTVRYPEFAAKDWSFLVEELREMWR
jgi:hypothetical protein